MNLAGLWDGDGGVGMNHVGMEWGWKKYGDSVG